MKIVPHKLGLGVMAVLIFVQHTAAIAMAPSYWTVTYIPSNSASVPTLSEWSMLVLSVLLAAVALFALRNRSGGKPLVSIVLLSALALAAVSGGKLMSQAQAVPTPQMSSATGGSVQVIRSGNETPLQNTTTIPLTVTGVSPSSGTTATSPTCAAGVTVPPSGYCYLKDSG